AEEHARAARELLRRDACRAEGVVDAVLQPKAARPYVERWKLVGAVPEDGYAERLEPTKGQGKVGHELWAGAHNHDGVPGDRLEVRGLIEALLGPAVDPADAAGRQDLDAGGRRDLDGGGDGRSAERTRGQDGRDVADRDLGHPGLVREPLEKHIARADDRDTVVQPDRCGPGRFTTSADPTAPATPRESIPCGVFSSDFARRASAIPGISRSITRRVASGVTSFGERPVPPVVRTTLAPARTAPRIAVATRSTSSGTTDSWTTSAPAATRASRMAGP